MKPQSLPHRLLVGTLSAMALLSATPTAVANPNAPIKILVGFAPGGGTDALARALADALQPVLKRTVIVENKPGGSGSIAAQSLKNSSPDGLSFMLVSDQFLITPMTLKAVGYDSLRDFRVVAGMTTFDQCLAVNASTVPSTTLKDYLTLAGKDSKLALYGVPALGSLPQFYGYAAAKAAGVALQAVPYRGGAPMVMDLLAGHVPAAIGPCREMMDPYKTGKIRFLATVQKIDWAPEVPTFSENQISVGPSNWHALFASANAPRESIEQMERAIRQVMSDETLKARITALGFTPRFVPRREIESLAREAATLWSRHIKESGFTPE